MVILPPSGMASLALTARLSSAFSSWLASAMVSHKPPGQHRLDGDWRAYRSHQKIRNAGNGFVEVQWNRIEGLQAGEGKKTVRQLGRTLGSLHRGVERPRQGSRGIGGHVREPAADRVEIAQDDGKKIIEIVRHASGELSDRLHLLRLPQRRFRRFPSGRFILKVLDEPGLRTDGRRAQRRRTGQAARMRKSRMLRARQSIRCRMAK